MTANRSDVIAREKRFWNARSGGSYEAIRGAIVRSIGEFARYGDRDALFDPRDKVVLDYGCGQGPDTADLIRRDARHVTGIDVSEAEIDRARAAAKEAGFSERTDFLVADAHATGFSDDSFDLVVGDSILHHLDLRAALAEIRRILRPGGRAVFSEPLAHNPILRLGRALTPTARTADEHPFTTADWEVCAEIFPGFRHFEREFLTIPLMPLNLLLPRTVQQRLARRVFEIDDRLLDRHAGLGKYARLTFLVLEQ